VNNLLNKIRKSEKGFTLTEVMIGMMILTIAIVAASNLLVSLVRTNRINTETLQAYYLSQEGIEAVRNIRDTNWMHNFHIGQVGIYPEFEKGKIYYLNDTVVWLGDSQMDAGMNYLIANSPWRLNVKNAPWDNEVFKILDFVNDKFYRQIEILEKPECEEAIGDEYEDLNCSSFFKIRSIVSWRDGSKKREVILETVLSDWKGGAL